MEKVVFIVDDNETYLTVIASALEKEYRVYTMRSAIQMYAFLEKVTPDIVILDIEMPDVNGLDVLARMKTHPEWKTIPVVFLTGWSDEGLTADAFDLGAADVIDKTEDLPVLLASIQKNMK